jgi:hypothetical protein
MMATPRPTAERLNDIASFKTLCAGDEDEDNDRDEQQVGVILPNSFRHDV